MGLDTDLTEDSKEDALAVSQDLYKKLSWLPSTPPDFTARCKALSKESEDLGRRVQHLASYALDEHQLSRLGRIIADFNGQNRSLSPLSSAKLGILGNGTLDFVIPALVASAARHGLALECIKGDYDQYLQDAILPGSRINVSKPDFVLLAMDYRALKLSPNLAGGTQANQTIDAAIALVETIRTSIRRHSGAVCLICTLAPPPESLFGSLDRVLQGTSRSIIAAVNERMTSMVAESGDVLLDVAALAETVGLADWHSPSLWNFAKLPFADAFVPLYADHVARILAAMQGRTRRCLVLDLDNTLWGGVIGDDGLDGIKLAQGDPTGEAHLSVQRLALTLRERGVVLAVSSKNTESIARAPFVDHPDMILREEHIAVFQANWDDKATNLRTIANNLSLGLQSLVFLDDNPAERELIRRELPEVAVPELDDDPASFARTLSASGYFESVRFLDEDRRRAEMYVSNARRLDDRQQFTDMDSYLQSLQMELRVGPFNSSNRPRVTQLVNKSNQFNLTSRRYSEAEIEQFELSHGHLTLQARLLDKFGDNGIICVVICRPKDVSTWEIDSWLMSCRVLGRRVENAILNELLRRAQADGIEYLIGIYRPTSRNMMVRDHYKNLGFNSCGDGDDETTHWRLAVGTQAEVVPMIVTSEDGTAVTP